MNTQPLKSSEPAKQNILKQTIKNIQTAVIVAFISATMFTAWTDPGLFPENFSSSYTLNFPPKITEISQNIFTTTETPIPVVGIVAGHSGHDSGAVCSDGLTEVSINQQIATYVQKILAQNKIKTEILSEFDERLIGYKAIALVSIHADSCEYINNEATGFKIAAPLSNPRPDRTARLTACLRKRYAQSTGLSLHNSITLDMTSYHAFDEINAETPAAIIEIGFMNLDRQLLTQKPDLIAQGIAAGILCYINNEDISK